jgi:5-methylcytosine-specific restriction endonuclease McrA
LFESRLDGLARDRRELDQLEAEWVFRAGEYDRSGEWQAHGFASAAAAIGRRCRMAPAAAAATVKLARRLEHLPETANAFEKGQISRQHAEMIAAPCTRERREMMQGIERELIVFAKLANPIELRYAVKRMTDAHDGDGGAKDDAAQIRKNRVNLSPSFDGRGVLHGSLDAESTEIAISAIDAMMAALKKPGDTREFPELRAEAFVEICRRSAADVLVANSTRRERPHLSGVFDISALEDTQPDLVNQARIEGEHVGQLSRVTLERLLCDCQFTRILTDGASTIIDVGRTTRTVPFKLWKAMVVRDRHCTEPDCQVPAGFCEAHHIWYWSRGGPTNLENLRLLCWFHHRQQHQHDAQPRPG